MFFSGKVSFFRHTFCNALLKLMVMLRFWICWAIIILLAGCDPNTASLYINKIFGDEFWMKDPGRYPSKSYYGVATNLRFNLAFGQGVSMRIKPVGLSSRMKFFYEFGANDLYIISYFTNKYLRVPDIFNLSVGIKLQFL